MMNRWITGLLLLGLTLQGHAEGQTRPFKGDSLETIVETHAGEPFILVLWEMSCLPCHEEMEVLGKLRQQHDDFNLVFVSTDDYSLRTDAEDLLRSHALDGVESWMFAEPNIERLRYSIDPEWYGELPRNYFYDVDSSRLGFSGKLTTDILDGWLSAPSSPSPD